MNSEQKYVIIGGGVAAVGCIEGIRSVDKQSSITMISAEKYPVYCRPLISYYLQGKTDFERMMYRPDSFYKDNNCEIIYDAVVKINKDEKTVELSCGEKVEYTSLCVATGSSPFVPPFKGIETVKQKYAFMTYSDALSLQKAVKKQSRVLIIGAGLIGLKCAEGLCSTAKSITVCDLANSVLSSILDSVCAERIQSTLEAHGVSFMLGDTPDSFNGNTAVMKSGKNVEFDVLVTAVGVRPNIKLIADSGGECNRGIVVDTSMKTSIDSIFAAGDCTCGYDASINENRVIAILPNAYMQGSCAGINMAGKKSRFDNAIPMNAIGFFGLHALTAGVYKGEVYEEKTDDSIKRLYVENGFLVGFMLIGDIERAGIYTALIREKTPLDSVDFELLKKSPSLIAFSCENRRKKLGGVV